MGKKKGETACGGKVALRDRLFIRCLQAIPPGETHLLEDALLDLLRVETAHILQHRGSGRVSHVSNTKEGQGAVGRTAKKK